MTEELTAMHTMETIRIRGARQHNLRDIDVDIPRGKLVVITGPSGCGKSSLAFHTLYAEGQRRYVESLSVYARQFLDQLEKPDVDEISGLSPAIAIEQRVGSLSPRSTVATATEIYDYLRVLWAAAGVPHDPETGERLERMGAAEIVAHLAALPEGTKVVLLAPVPREEHGEPERLLGDLRRQGFVRVRVDGEMVEVEEAASAWPENPESVAVVVDRLVIRPGAEARLADSVETALRICGVEARAAVQEAGAEEWRDVSFQTSYRNEATGFTVDEITPKHFSFNSQLGACEACEGLGSVEGRTCAACGGKRLRREWQAVKVQGAAGEWLGIQEFCGKNVEQAAAWIAGFSPDGAKLDICKRLASDVRKRLSFLQEVGLGYLTLDRGSGTLSGGEAQRTRLAGQLGAGLSGVLYVLDEPSIGLHAADTQRLIAALLRLRDLGNTVVVVEHDEEVMRAADWVIDMGKGAGRDGGEVLAAGPPGEITSPTGEWLHELSEGKATVAVESESKGALVVRGAREHNLRGIDVEIPLGQIVCVCGPSGSGKSTLIDDVLRRALATHFNGANDEPGEHDGIEGLDGIGKFVVVDQSPIGRSPRSNPATFTGAYDLIRAIFAKLPLAKQRGYGAKRFSFNMAGGRCERCLGNGRLKVEMHFLPDAWVTCDACAGRRFNRETLEVTYKGRSISEVLELTVSEALEMFRSVPKLHRIFSPMVELGLGYLVLGQAANTLSGGEAQRLKLAAELAKPQAPHTLYLFDEPTTGLHFGDVARLQAAFLRLRKEGHSVLVVEHQLDIIAQADWIVELGPGGGEHGGALVFSGKPSALVENTDSPTGRALAGRGG